MFVLDLFLSYLGFPLSVLIIYDVVFRKCNFHFPFSSELKRSLDFCLREIFIGGILRRRKYHNSDMSDVDNATGIDAGPSQNDPVGPDSVDAVDCVSNYILIRLFNFNHEDKIDLSKESSILHNIRIYQAMQLNMICTVS